MLLLIAWWGSYFTLHWLVILDVIPATPQSRSTIMYFLLVSVVVTLIRIGQERWLEEHRTGNLEVMTDVLNEMEELGITDDELP